MSKTLNIIGAGRVASTLARGWFHRGVYDVGDVINSTLESARQAVTFIGAGQARDDMASLGRAPVWMIGVHDSAIEPTAERLANEAVVTRGDTVFHCSGSLGAGSLSSLAEQGAQVASLHPVRSFVAPLATPQEFAGTWCALEGDVEALGELRPALEQIGARVLSIDAANKLLYHAASVFSCNYLSALMEVALRVIERAGVNRATGLELLEPLVRGTVDNLFEHGPATALTGPIARGDHRLVARQLSAVAAWSDEHADLYRRLGEVARGWRLRKARCLKWISKRWLKFLTPAQDAEYVKIDSWCV